jgi:response regulator RpfG family c-di-GMP phosphodiesterase
MMARFLLIPFSANGKEGSGLWKDRHDKIERQMKILVAEDDPGQREMVSILVGKLGCKALTAKDGKQAWRIFQDEHPRLVLTDWKMPGMNGLDLCRRIREAEAPRYTYLIVISGQNTNRDIVRGLTGGIDDYVTKPIRVDELRARIKIGIRIVTLENELASRYETIRENYVQTIRMFNNLIEVYDRDLGGHSRRAADLSLEIARRHPGIPEDDLKLIETAALLKEIGMIGLPAPVLAKSRVERNGDETALYRTHPEMGEIILNGIEYLKPVAALVRAHHEQYNGLGFPDGLKGEEIPLPARIISAATVYDNLIYRGGFDDETVVQKLLTMRGFQLDPRVVGLLLEVHKTAVEEKRLNHYAAMALTELEVGMCLARDFHGATGALLLPSGTRLNRISIEKLRKHSDLTGLTEKAYVYRSP